MRSQRPLRCKRRSPCVASACIKLPGGLSFAIMSARQTRRALSLGAEGMLDCNSDERDSNDEYESHKAKRANKKSRTKSRTKPDVSKQDVDQKRVKGVRGRLKMLTEMPLDILFEVGSKISRHSQGLSANIFTDIWPPSSLGCVTSGSNHKVFPQYPYVSFIDFNLEKRPR
jgi:hypothetical protein